MVEELAELAVTEGISAFIVMPDDAETIQRIGQEVAPAVRELVQAERHPEPKVVPSASMVGKPRAAAVGRHLIDVHDQLRAELESARDVLSQVRRGAADARAARSVINDALDLLSDALLSHLAYEEDQLVEPLARLGFHPSQV